MSSFLSTPTPNSLTHSTSTEEIYKKNSFCTIFEKQLWRSDRCKHCFKTEFQHSVNISRFNENVPNNNEISEITTDNINNNNNNNNHNHNNTSSTTNTTAISTPTPKNNISNNNPYLNNLKNINNNNNNNNNNSPLTPTKINKNINNSNNNNNKVSNSGPTSPSTSPNRKTNSVVPSVERAPLSIRRSLTPKAIEQFSRQISSQLLVSEPLSLPPQTIINNINKQTQKPKPPPLPTKNFQLEIPPTFSSTVTTPDTTSPTLSSFSLDPTTTTTTTISVSPTSTASSTPIPTPTTNSSNRQTTIISPVLLAISEYPPPTSPTRQMRSHSDSPSDYNATVNGSSGSGSNINNSSISIASSNSSISSNTSSGSGTSSSNNNSRPINISNSNLIYEKKHTRNSSGGSPFLSGSSSSPTNSSPLLPSQAPSSKVINNLNTGNSSNNNNNSVSSGSPRKYSIFVGKSNKSKLNINNSQFNNNSTPNLPTSKRPLSTVPSLKSTSFPNVADAFSTLNNNNNNTNINNNNNNNQLNNSSNTLYNNNNYNYNINNYNNEEQNKIYLAINSILLSLPNINNLAVQQMMDILYNQHLDLDSNTTLIKNDKMNELCKATQTLQQWIERQDHLRDVIRVQSCVRRFLSKRRTEWLSQVYNHSILRDRNQEFRGLIQLERRYNEKLDITINTYYKRLKHSNLLNRMDLQSIFSSIKQIYYVHKRISLQFEELFKKWPCVEGLGDIFLRIAPELRVYGGYVKNFKNAIDTLISCQEENPKFGAFLRELCEDTPGKVYDLMALIAAPLNHLTGYERQLFNIALYTPQNWPDYVNIVNAVTMMKEVETLIQDSLGQAQNASTLMAIYRRVNNRKALDPFVIPGRIFIHEGKLVKFELKKQDQIYYYYLCNDLILFVKNSNGSGNNINIGGSAGGGGGSGSNDQQLSSSRELFKFKKLFMLSDVVVTDLQDTSTHKNIISIVNQNNSRESYCFSIEDSREKKELMKQFSALCCTTNTNKSTKIFGISLFDLAQREDDVVLNSNGGIPIFIIKTCNAILQHHLNDEGIFRVSPNQSELESIRDQLNKCATESQLDTIIAKISNGHQLAALLKSYFRELAIPLLTFELFDKIIEQFGDNDDSSTAENVENHINDVKSLLQSIPQVNQNTFQLILLLLVTVAANSQNNKMNHINLSIVFTPNLLKPKIPTIEQSLRIPILNNFITSLLDNYSLLYNDKLDSIKIIDSKFHFKKLLPNNNNNNSGFRK
ncbi:hypothetical protein ACTFIR_007900 [Dictyostelium discoideum]